MYDMQTSSPFIIGFVQRTTILGPYLHSSRKELREKVQNNAFVDCNISIT
jgi:hypothetical protein